tara:strand:- start:917 stop:1408 length:492 start_codon:yes stop_codon:yes gene_type:complete
MIKKISLIFLSIFFILSNGCAGYKPIYSNSNLEFKIVDYTIKGDKRLGNKIYSKLYNLSRTKKNLDSDKSIILLIDTSLNKNETSKDSSGKVLEYKLTLIAKIEILDFLSNDRILNQAFVSSLSYKVQSQYSETLKLENSSIENLIDKTYKDLLVKLAQNINT